MEPVQNNAVIDLPKVAHRPEEQILPTELAAGFEAQMAVEPPAAQAPMPAMAEIETTGEAAPPGAVGDAPEAEIADEVELVAVDGRSCPETWVIETVVIETPAEADAGGEVCPGAAAIPAHVLPEETDQRPASGMPVRAESILGVSGPGGAALGTTPDGVVPERQLGAQAALRSHDRADAPAPRVEEGPVLRQYSPLWLRVEAPADRAALATEGVAGQSRDPELSVPTEGKATPVIAATQPWTGSMPARPLARAETEMVIAQARETADFWAAPPGFSLPELAQAQLPVAGGVRPVLASPEGLCRQVGEAALKMQDDRIEIALSPEELGSVRLVLSRGEAGAAMTVWVERPEVLEMLRRNVDMLTADLQKSGLGDATLAFQDGSGDQGRSPAGHAPDGPVARGDFRRDGADDGSRTAGNGPRSRPRWTGAEGLRLDIRV